MQKRVCVIFFAAVMSLTAALCVNAAENESYETIPIETVAGFHPDGEMGELAGLEDDYYRQDDLQLIDVTAEVPDPFPHEAILVTVTDDSGKEFIVQLYRQNIFKQTASLVKGHYRVTSITAVDDITGEYPFMADNGEFYLAGERYALKIIVDSAETARIAEYDNNRVNVSVEAQNASNGVSGASGEVTAVLRTAFAPEDEIDVTLYSATGDAYTIVLTQENAYTGTIRVPEGKYRLAKITSFPEGVQTSYQTRVKELELSKDGKEIIDIYVSNVVDSNKIAEFDDIIEDGREAEKAPGINFKEILLILSIIIVIAAAIYTKATKRKK